MRKSMVRLFLAALLMMSGCSIDRHVESQHARDTVKVEDPFASEDERDFHGMIATFFALPKGESTLVRFPNGKKLLIDTGSAEDALKLQARLQDVKVTKLDYVLLTNDQPMHAGGYPHLAETIQIDTVIMPKLIFASVMNLVNIQSDKKLVLLSAKDKIVFDEKIELFVMHPTEPLLLSPQDNSLVFQLKHDRLGFLFTAGINEKAEERLLADYPDRLKSEILKVADQGSNQASSQPFLTKVDAQVAIVQTGKNRVEMRSTQAEVLERLGESWSETYITSQDGTITVLSNGKDYRVLKGDKKK